MLQSSSFKEVLITIITLVIITLCFRIEQLKDYLRKTKRKNKSPITLGGHVGRVMWRQGGIYGEATRLRDLINLL